MGTLRDRCLVGARSSGGSREIGWAASAGRAARDHFRPTIDRRDVMYNDFVIVGPHSDPAHIHGLKDARAALKQIAEAAAPFASRGDDSGTNRMELRLWKDAKTDVKSASGDWYKSLGQGMGPTLNTAAAMNAYTLSDRATWSKFATCSPISNFKLQIYRIQSAI